MTPRYFIWKFYVETARDMNLFPRSILSYNFSHEENEDMCIKSLEQVQRGMRLYIITVCQMNLHNSHQAAQVLGVLT